MEKMKLEKDVIFTNQDSVRDFRFDKKIVKVFSDMISRSVPFYNEVQTTMAELAQTFYVPGTVVYDLGCSLAEASVRIAELLPKDCKIIGIDNSESMVISARERINELGLSQQIDIRQGSITDPLPIDSASVIIMSLTLQFIRPVRRQAIIENIYHSLKPGGVLLMFEKILIDNNSLNRTFIDHYYMFKASNGYSTEETLRKRLSLENVLIPYTIPENVGLLERGGFENVSTFFQWMNFAGFIAVKEKTEDNANT